mmetsp:Transcript_87107/g.154139  ORF Transcript_87107/g.154139 Transcript_87107/m.154139 type:complete len:240 (-) Transcript_87107:871-1590(-)
MRSLSSIWRSQQLPAQQLCCGDLQLAPSLFPISSNESPMIKQPWKRWWTGSAPEFRQLKTCCEKQLGTRRTLASILHFAALWQRPNSEATGRGSGKRPCDRRHLKASKRVWRTSGRRVSPLMPWFRPFGKPWVILSSSCSQPFGSTLEKLGFGMSLMVLLQLCMLPALQGPRVLPAQLAARHRPRSCPTPSKSWHPSWRPWPRACNWYKVHLHGSKRQTSGTQQPRIGRSFCQCLDCRS